MTTSTHTSLAALRAPSVSPLAALAQIPSTLVFTLALSVGALATIDLHSATYCATTAALAAVLEPEEVEVVGVLAVALVEVVALLVGVVAAVEVLVVVVAVVVELLVVELLPHPARSPAQSSVAASSRGRVPIIESSLN